MAKFTKALRQQIVEDFAVRHNGNFNPVLFVEEVRRDGESHPAFEWFEWDEEKAALAYQVEQAREFARDLRVKFRVEEVGGAAGIRVTHQMPLVLSPMSGRSKGGGYVLVDTSNPDHVAEHCQQAAMALRSWLARYESALLAASVSPSSIERTVKALERVHAEKETVAA